MVTKQTITTDSVFTITTGPRQLYLKTSFIDGFDNISALTITPPLSTHFKPTPTTNLELPNEEHTIQSFWKLCYWRSSTNAMTSLHFLDVFVFTDPRASSSSLSIYRAQNMDRFQLSSIGPLCCHSLPTVSFRNPDRKHQSGVTSKPTMGLI